MENTTPNVHDNPPVIRQLDDAAMAAFDERWGEDHPDPRGATAALLASPTQAMFDAQVVELQAAGQMLQSPLTDEEARWLADELRDQQVLIYLLPSPQQ